MWARTRADGNELSEHLVPPKAEIHPVKDVDGTGRSVPACSHDTSPPASLLKRGRVYNLLLDNTTFGKHSVVTASIP